jgi:hypothetical protein
MRDKVLPLLGLCVICAIGLIPAVAADEIPAGLSVTTVRVPDGGNHPQVARGSDGRMHLIYFKGDPRHGDIFYVTSKDAGQTFTRPVRVNSQPGSAVIIGTVRGPHLSVGKNDRVHVAWMGSDRAEPKVDGKAPMLYTRLNDAGDGFEPQRNLIQNRAGLDGGGSVAADKDGNVYVAWHAPKDASGEADRGVWLSRSTDDGKTFAAEEDILPTPTGACGCCGLSIEAGDRGAVAVVYRTATNGIERDIHLLVSSDFGKSFTMAAADPWHVGTCVMSTASIAVTPTTIVSAWETREQIRLCTYDRKSGRAGASVAMPGPGRDRKYPSVAIDSQGNRLVAWTEGTGWEKGGSVAWQLFSPEGQAVARQSGRAADLPAWDVPATFAVGAGRFVIVY